MAGFIVWKQSNGETAVTHFVSEETPEEHVKKHQAIGDYPAEWTVLELSDDEPDMTKYEQPLKSGD